MVRQKILPDPHWGRKRELGVRSCGSFHHCPERWDVPIPWFVCFFAGRLSLPWDAHDPNMLHLKTLFFYPLTSNKDELKPLRPNFKFLSGKTNDSLGQVSQTSVTFDFSKRLTSRTPRYDTVFWFSTRSHSGKEFTCQGRRCKRCEFDPWVRKISWRGKWQPAPVFLPGKFHGQRILASKIHGVTKSQTRLIMHAKQMHTTAKMLQYLHSILIHPVAKWIYRNMMWEYSVPNS